MNLLNSTHYYDSLIQIMEMAGSENMSLAQHAEMWYYENVSVILPDHDTLEWEQMYDDWVAYAFKDMKNTNLPT